MAKGHIPFLDGVRGMAVLLVFCYHCAPYGWKASWLSFGWSGVDLFFVLSGFLITGILLKAKDGKNYYKNFFVRRFLRLFPLYYSVLLFVIYLLPWLGYQLHNHETLRDIQVYFWTYVPNVFIALKGNPEFTGFNHFWSLGVEEQFYLIWPLIVRNLKPKNLLKLAVIGILGSIALRNINPYTPFAYMFPLCRTEGLLLGCIAAVLVSDNYKLKSAITLSGLAVSALVVAIVSYYSGTMDLNGKYWIHIGYTAIDLVYFFLLLTLFAKGKVSEYLQKAFSPWALRQLGKYSYGVYVYHAIILYILFDDKIKDGVDFLLISGATIVISILSFHFLEMPFLRLKRHFEYGS